MTAANVSRLGDINQGGAPFDELFLKVFSGETLAAFKRTNVFLPLHMVRTIASGKSAQFPATGRTTAAYHTPGAEILGNDINHAERVIAIQQLLIAHAFIANIDEAMNHYDVRSIYSNEIGEALARQMDNHIVSTIINGARASATVADLQGGSVQTNAAFVNDGEVLAAGIFAAAVDLDNRHVPEMERYCALRPAQYSLLAQTTKVLNRDWQGSGSYSDGKVVKVGDVTIVKSTNIPSTNVATGPTEFQGDFTNTVGIVWHKSAAGTVKLLDLAMESEYDIRRQGTLMVGKYACGHDYLRPESAVELASA